MGRRKNWKKAFVSLKPGQEINFVEGVLRNGSRQSQTDLPGRRAVVRSSMPICTRASRSPAAGRVQSKNAGRNNNGRITVRHQGGGHKQHLSR